MIGAIGWRAAAYYHVLLASLLVTTSLLRFTSARENSATHGKLANGVNTRSTTESVANEGNAGNDELANGGWYVVKKFRKIPPHETFPHRSITQRFSGVSSGNG